MRDSIQKVRLLDRIIKDGNTYVNLGYLKRGDAIDACIFENKEQPHDWLKVDRENFKTFQVIENTTK